MALIGNTIRVKAEFRGFDGELISPSDVKLKVYDKKKNLIEEFDVQPYDLGKYQYDYVIEEEISKQIYFEYVGTHGGMPILGRKEVKTKWI